jgi:transposase
MNVLYLTIKRKYNRGMQLRYNYRLYPTPGQRQALARAFGCARVVFDDALRARQEAFAAGLPYLTDAELSARLTAAKATPQRAWLGEVSAVVLQQALADLNTAYRNWPSPSTTRAGRRSWRCWNTRPGCTAGSSTGSAGSSPPRRCARHAG